MGTFTAAVQLPHTYDSFGDFICIQPLPWKVLVLRAANALFVDIRYAKRQHTL